MPDKYFMDTNILVYSFDTKEESKKNVSQNIISEALESNNGIISYQVVQEFLNVATRKFTKPMPMADATLYLHQVLNPLCEVYPSITLYDAGLVVSQKTNYSFYDSLIIAAALESNCTILYTEDLQDGQKISSLLIKNPFK